MSNTNWDNETAGCGNGIKNVVIVTGFLGSGKTTFINHLLATDSKCRRLIIENEFGKESIDGKLLAGRGAPVIELTQGCICCSINEQLYEVLNDLYLQRHDFDELVIEATGIADPAAIAEPFLLHPAVSKTFRLKQVVCLVDAEQIKDQLAQTDEAVRQIAFSNLLLLSKTKALRDEAIAQLCILLAGINPMASISDFTRQQPFIWQDIKGFDEAIVGRSTALASRPDQQMHAGIKSITINLIGLLM